MATCTSEMNQLPGTTLGGQMYAVGGHLGVHKGWQGVELGDGLNKHIFESA